MHIIHNARIYTQNPASPFAEAIAIHQGRILACGSLDEVEAYEIPGATRQDGHGAFLMPGLTDSHIHLQLFAESQLKVDCETDTLQECLSLVARHAQNIPAGEWILGHGWNQHSWDEGFGTAAMLDAVAPDNPVYLTAKSLHAGWCNTAALRLMGVDTATSDPQGGRFGRDTGGNPDGILFESAMECIEPLLPQPTLERTTAAIQKAQLTLWRCGITGVHDFDTTLCFQALQTLHRECRLHLRVLKSVPLEKLSAAIDAGIQTGFGDDMLRIGSVKLFADGALGPRTAAMLSPYENDPQNRGMLFLDQEEVYETGRLASAAGISMAVHAIGDRANHEVLQGYARLRQYEEENHLPRLRHRIEHVQALHPDDLLLLARLGITASMQPIHLPSDWQAANRNWGSRSESTFTFRSLMHTGTTLAFGSDAPVESPNPFWGVQAAITRSNADAKPEGGWYPDQKLTLEEALHGFTTGAARAAGCENILGRLMPGYLADMVMLPQDIFTIPVHELRIIQPLATMVNGEWVWQENG
jgi:predicted amidohydrolase YtcJ